MRCSTLPRSNGYGVVREYVGHGVGRVMHEDPNVPNYGKRGRGVKLQVGMTIAIEPMITLGTYKNHTLANGWTVVTNDGKPAAHYENTIGITEDGPVILTQDEDGPWCPRMVRRVGSNRPSGRIGHQRAIPAASLPVTSDACLSAQIHAECVYRAGHLRYD